MRKLITFLTITCVLIFAGYQAVKAWETSGGLEVIRGEILGGNMNANNKEITNLKSLTFYAASELTISGDTMTVTQAVHTVDGEGNAADDLATISGGNDEEIILLRPENAARNITLKHGTGNIVIGTASDYIIPDNGMVFLQYDGSNWRMIGGGGDLVTDLTPQLGGDLDCNTNSILFSAAQEKTATLTGFESGNQTITSDVANIDGNNMLVRQIRAYISTDPTTDENINFRLSLYNADSMTEDELIKDWYFNLTYTETNGGASATDTTDTIDDGSGIIKYDLIRYIGGTAENVRLTGTPTATTIAFTALANSHSTNTGIVRVEEITNSFFLVDSDASNEIHVKLEALSAATASMSVVVEIDLQ